MPPKRGLPRATFIPTKLTTEQMQIVASRTEDGDVKDMSVVQKDDVKIGQKLVATFDIEFIDPVPNENNYNPEVKKAQVQPVVAIGSLVKKETNGLKGFRIPFDDAIRTIEFMKKQSCNVQFRQFTGTERKIKNIGIVPKIHKIDCGVTTDKPPCLGNEREVAVHPAADIYVFDGDYKTKKPLPTFHPGVAGAAGTATTPSVDGTPVTLARHLWKPIYHKHISSSQMGNGSIAGTLNEVVDTEKHLPITLRQPYVDVAWSGIDENVASGVTLLKLQIEYSYERMSDYDMYNVVLNDKIATCSNQKNEFTGIPSRLFSLSTLNGYPVTSRILVKTNGCNVIQVTQPNVGVLDQSYWDSSAAVPIYASEIDTGGVIRVGTITQLPEIKSSWTFN